MKKWQVALLALFFVGLATVVIAAPPDPGSPHPQGFQKPWAHHAFGSRLNLTQE